MKQHRDAWFAAADTNKDGQLSKAELMRPRARCMVARAMAVRATAAHRSRRAEGQCSE